MRILYLGDIHGDFNIINQYIKLYNIKNAYIIQIGDFGVGFTTFDKDRRNLQMTNEALKKRNIILYAIRGNHDRPDYFENDPFNFTNIKLVKDYTVLELEDKKILCIGGAISVDRVDRYTRDQKNGLFDIKGNENWWRDEKFIFDNDKLKDLRDINIVVTHTAPDYCPIDNSNGFGPFVNSYIKRDKGLNIELMEERRDMTLAFQTIKENNDITHHYYGHFHRSDYINMYGIKHRVLNINELWEER